MESNSEDRQAALIAELESLAGIRTSQARRRGEMILHELREIKIKNDNNNQSIKPQIYGNDKVNLKKENKSETTDTERDAVCQPGAAGKFGDEFLVTTPLV